MAINHGSLSARLTPKKTLKGTVQTATIAYESDYERLTNKPSINNIEVIGDLSLDDLGIVNNVQPDWEQDDTEAEDYIKNKPEIPDAQIQSDWEQTDEEAKDYIKNKPEIPSAQVQSDWNEADNTKPGFIKNKPTVPPEQVNSDWNAVSGKAQILNKPTIPSVIANPGNTTENLTSIGIDGTNYAIQGGGGGGAVNDVKVNETSVVDSQGVANIDLTGYATTSDIPTDLADLQDDSTHRLVTDTEKAEWDAKADTSDIPTVNNSTIIIQKNGQNVDTFTLNQNTNKTVDISVPTKTSDLQNDSSFITNTVNNLANYYLKSETYTKTEVSNLIDAAVNGRFEKVQTLPVTGEANVIYLVPKTTALTNNVYDEYIWQDNAWELLGSTEIDLSGYVTDTDLTTALADYVTTSAFNTAIANYYTKTEVGNLLDDKVDKVSGKGLSTNDYDNTAKSIVDGVTDALADKVDKVTGKGLSTNDYSDTDKAIVSGVTSALAGKADKTAISSVETTSTAVAAHAVGSYFINASGQFVKTTSAIAIGDTIIVKPTVGYNCEATTIGDVLEAANTEIKTSKYQKIYTVTGNGTTDTIATILNKIYNNNTFSHDKFYILIFDNDVYNITTYLSNQVRFGKIGGNDASTVITNCHLKASNSKMYIMSINNVGTVTVTDNSSSVTSYTFDLYQVG